MDQIVNWFWRVTGGRIRTRGQVLWILSATGITIVILIVFLAQITSHKKTTLPEKSNPRYEFPADAPPRLKVQ